MRFQRGATIPFPRQLAADLWRGIKTHFSIGLDNFFGITCFKLLIFEHHMKMAVPNSAGVVRLLVVNPNSSADMTHGVEKAIHSMGLPAVRH